MIPRGSLLCQPAGGPVTVSAGAAATTGSAAGVSGCERAFDEPDRRWCSGAFRLGNALAAALVRPGQLRPQARVLGPRGGDLRPEPRDLVLPRVIAHA